MIETRVVETGGRGRTRTCDLLRVKLPSQPYVAHSLRGQNAFKPVLAASPALIAHRSAQNAGVCNELRKGDCK